MSHTFVEGREIEDAAAVLVRFSNGSLGTLEATKFGVGVQNRNAFEIHGSNGMLAFNLEDMNRLVYVDARVPKRMQGPAFLPVSGPDQPYANNFWRAGHVIGYEHTFIAALGDFLTSLERGTSFHPDFEDGVRVQEVLDAVERSAAAGAWITL
jgi:predicted dehydrogenase